MAAVRAGEACIGRHERVFLARREVLSFDLDLADDRWIAVGQLDVAVNAACRQRLHRIDHGHERSELDLDGPGGTLGGSRGLRRRDNDRLADIAHVFVTQAAAAGRRRLVPTPTGSILSSAVMAYVCRLGNRCDDEAITRAATQIADHALADLLRGASGCLAMKLDADMMISGGQ